MKTFVLSLDGVPHSLLKAWFAQGQMPHFAKFAQEYGMQRMDSVYPTVSSVAWTTYATGLNPAEHGIFGFADRLANPFEIMIPTARNRKAPALWQILSRKKRRVIVINVPLTYPPEAVNGILIAGFLCTDINDISYPDSISRRLKSMGYIIDVDAWLARESKQEFMKKLYEAMEKRFDVAFELMAKEKWDFFHLHIMETDRLFHFFWDDVQKQGEFSGQIAGFFKNLDDRIGSLLQRLGADDTVLVLSDHGFCQVKADLQLNLWLKNEGLLKLDDKDEKKLPSYAKESLCYSMTPGRVYINLKGREEKGSVRKDDYEKVREDIKRRLKALGDPESGESVIDKVFLREEIYSGPYLREAADIIVHPKNGYDLKARVEGDKIFDRTVINGMHTYDDAFISARNMDIASIRSIQDVTRLVLERIE